MKRFLLKQATVLEPSGLTKSHQTLVIDEGLIAWCGPDEALPHTYQGGDFIHEDCNGQLITPGLIDCHTHLVYGGDRIADFALRQAGMSYAHIANKGGGILSTVRATRDISEQALFDASYPRLQALCKEGVTTVEIKSGYGLTFSSEQKMLRVAKALGKALGVRVKTTFLGAHAIAPEFSGRPQAYVDLLCEEMLPRLVEEQLVDAVDVFCEHIAFSLSQTEQIFETAQALSLPLKCHADQLSNMQAAHLAARFGALSCDHLEYLDEKSAQMMAKKGSVAVLLPGAFYFLNELKKPPVALLRDYKIPMAIATDLNPGSSPTASLLLMMSMGVHFFGLTVEEVLLAVTTHAAKALGIEKKVGLIQAGYVADLNRWSFEEKATLCYYFGYPLAHDTMVAGQWVSFK